MSCAGIIRPCHESDFVSIWEIISDGAQKYKAIIPADCWTEPYMPREKLRHEIDAGVAFWGYEQSGALAGVMGIQPVLDVTLIRHAYVRSGTQRGGIGGRLLRHLREMTNYPVLIGTWADAVWAIRFYEKHGFALVDKQEKDRLLKKYWSIPERQAETSVVLADTQWRERQRANH